MRLAMGPGISNSAAALAREADCSQEHDHTEEFRVGGDHMHD
jgi:hypothetical protein